MTRHGTSPSALFVEHLEGAIALASNNEDAALAVIAEVEHWLVRYLTACAASALGSGSDFNKGVVRGLEIAAAQVEHGHYQNHPPSSCGCVPPEACSDCLPQIGGAA